MGILIVTSLKSIDSGRIFPGLIHYKYLIGKEFAFFNDALTLDNGMNG
jgi:hypothetical protein